MRKYKDGVLGDRGSRIAEELGLGDFAEACQMECYKNLAKMLGKVEDVRKAGLVFKRFYGCASGEKRPYFPNGRQLGGFMARFMAMGRAERNGTPSEDEVEPYADRILKAFGVENKGFALLDRDIGRADWPLGDLLEKEKNVLRNNLDVRCAIQIENAVDGICCAINTWRYGLEDDVKALALYIAASSRQRIRDRPSGDGFKALFALHEKGLPVRDLDSHGRLIIVRN